MRQLVRGIRRRARWLGAELYGGEEGVVVTAGTVLQGGRGAVRGMTVVAEAVGGGLLLLVLGRKMA